jgi:type I restriction enzyme S subunit
MNEMKEVPDGWEVVSIGTIASIYTGYGFPIKLQGKSQGKYPFYKVSDISKNVQLGNKYLEFCENYIDDNEIDILGLKLFPKNTIVFAKIGESLKLNRRAMTKQLCIVDNNAIGLKAIERLCSDYYLFYFLMTIKLGDYSRATTVPSVRKLDIENIEIAFPNIPEQHRIVT